MLIDYIKKALRITSTHFDEEVKESIDAAKRELERVGIAVDDTDPLIRAAIKNYCKSDFGYDNPEADRFMKSFESMKNAMSLSGDYNELA